MDLLQKVKPSHSTHLNQSGNDIDWCVTDLASHYPGRVAISGSEIKTRLTFVSLFEIEIDGGDVEAESVFKKEFSKQTRSEVWRLVSFINESTLVTCLDDSLEKISISSTDVIHAKKLPFGGVSCISVKNEEIFIGVSGSSEISIFNLQLLQTRVVNLTSLQNSWPIDLATTSDGVSLFCALGGEDKIVMSVEDGGKCLKLKNPLDRGAVPLSVSICKDAEIVAVSWHCPSEVTLHSISSGFCLGVAEIKPVERVQSLGEGQLGAIDTKGEFKIFQVAQLFTFDNLKALLCCLLSPSDCQRLHKLFEINSKTSKKEESFNNGDVKTFLDVLEDHGHFDSENTVSLKDAIKGAEFSENGERVVAAIEAYDKLSARGSDVDAERDPSGRNKTMKRAADETEEICKDWKKLKKNDDATVSVVEEPGMNAQSLDNEHLEEAVAPTDQQQCRDASPDCHPDGDVEFLTSSGNSGWLSHRLISEFCTALAEKTQPLLNELKLLRNELAKIRTLKENGSSSCGEQSCCSHSCLPPCANRSSHCCHTYSGCLYQSCCHGHSNHHGTQAAPQTNVRAQAAATSTPSSGQTLPQPNYSQTHFPQPNMISPFMHALGYPQYLPGPFPPMQYPVMQQNPVQPTNQPMYFGSPALQQMHPPPVGLLQPQTQNLAALSTPVRGSTPGHSEGNASSSNYGVTNNPPQTHATSALNLSADGAVSNPSRDQVHESGSRRSSAKPSSSAKETVARVAGFLRTVPTKVYLGITPREAEESAAAVKSCLQSSSDSAPFLSGFPSVLRKELLQYKDQDDPKAREQVVKVMMKSLFTEEERAESNYAGKRGYRQIDREKLFLVKEIVFLVCPFVGGKDDEQTKAKEWKRLCTYIDVSNRHVRHKFRQLSKREEEANSTSSKVS